MRRFSLIYLIAILGLLISGCGGTGPEKMEIPDFYPPTVSVVSQSPEKAVVNTDLVLTVSAKDNSGTPSVKMFYRRIDTTNFTELAAGATSTGNNLVYTIPSANIQSPGIEYYFTVNDGTNTVVSPAGAPATLYQVPLKYIKFSDHTEIGQVRALSEVIAQTQITSDGTTEVGTPAAVKTGMKYWQNGNQAATLADVIFTKVDGSDFYKGTIAANILVAGTWNYYLFTESSYSDGTTVSKTYPDNASTAANFLTMSPTVGFNNKPVITPRVLNESDKLYVNDVVKLYVDIVDDGPADQNFTFNWTPNAGTGLSLSENDVRNPQTKSGVPGTFGFSVTVTDADGQKSDTASITLNIETPTLSGEIAADINTLVLSSAASPYTVVGDFTVPAGKTLKIERGVQVKFKNETGIIVKGTLQADGDAENPITFTADTTLPYAGYWKGLYLGDPADPTIPSNPQSTISYCTIEYSRDGLVIKNAESPTISNCTIQNNQVQGIFCQDANLTIHKCIITSNGDYGVYCKRSGNPAVTNLPYTYATISSNTISKNLIAGVYCETARIDLAKNDITENKYGVFIKECKTTDSEIVNIVSNKLYNNADGIRVLDSNVVISGNKIYTNKDNGIVGYSSAAAIAANFFTTLDIRGNAIHNNNDDGIHLEDCYTDQVLTYATYRTILNSNPHITNNIITFSGAEGIELIGSSPIIARNHIIASADNGLLCKESTSGRHSSPFIANTNFLENARAGIAVMNDRIHGGNCAPSAWWCNFYANNKGMIDIQVNAGFDLWNFMNIGSPPPWAGSVDPDDAGPLEPVDLVADTRYNTGGRTYYLYTGGAAPTAVNATGGTVTCLDANGNQRFGWNVNTSPTFESPEREDPFTGDWFIKSDSKMPRNGNTGDTTWLKIQDNYPTSGLINSGEPLSFGVATPWDLGITNAALQVGGSTSPPYNIPGDTGNINYINVNSNSNLSVYNFVWFNWPSL